MPEEVKKEAEKQLRAWRDAPGLGESSVVRTYSTGCELPWKKRPRTTSASGRRRRSSTRTTTTSRRSRSGFSSTLVRKLKDKMKADPLLRRSPGVGRLPREVDRRAMGGSSSHVPWSIRTRRRSAATAGRTWALPGRVIQGMKQAGRETRSSCWTRSTRWGDFRATVRALLRGAGPEQNFAFSDNYLNVPSTFRRSCSSQRRTSSTRPAALKDRMEIITLSDTPTSTSWRSRKISPAAPARGERIRGRSR